MGDLLPPLAQCVREEEEEACVLAPHPEVERLGVGFDQQWMVVVGRARL